MAASLVVEQLSYGVKQHSVLADISLTVQPGEMLGLIGPNGSGKSTLLRLMAGLLNPSGGEVLLNGTSLVHLSRRHIAQQLTMMAQRTESDSIMRARDVVKLGRTPWLSLWRPWGEEDDRIVDAALAGVKMQNYAQRLWHSLSGGEQQRVQLARGMAQQPTLFLLDEPTNHLDIHHQLKILDTLSQSAMTKVIALHDLNHAYRCDRIGVLSQGRLVALGTPADILTPAFMAQIFKVRAVILTDPDDQGLVLRLASL